MICQIERRVEFDLHYSGGFTQAETAEMLKVHRKQATRLWLVAAGRLAKWLDGAYALW